MGIGSLMGITRIAMSAYQTAIDTTARNIANVDNPAYSRRRADIGSMVSPNAGRNAGVGNAGAEGIARIKEHFVQNQLWHKQQSLGKNTTDELVFTQIERTFGEPSESGLANVLTHFWNSWNDLANDPESSTARTIVKDRAVLLSRTFNQVSGDLHNLQREIGYDIDERITQINNLLEQIREINGYGGPAMTYDLLDSRDHAIDQLSKLVNINVSENSNHVVTVTTGGNVLVPLVTGDFINRLSTHVPQVSDLYRVDVSFEQGGSVAALTGGELGSLLAVHNDYLPEYVHEVDLLAASVAREVNALHATGYNLDNDTGTLFFKDNIEDAASMAVADAIVGDPNLIASSDAFDEAGNGKLAQAISDLQYAEIAHSHKPSDFYSGLISSIGSRVQEAQFLRNNHELVIQSLENQRDSVSGVSIDEEMTNLVRYEQAYEAATRLVSVVDDLMQAVINLI
jgi:flagellar hook-associated protein 1 FlgK